MSEYERLNKKNEDAVKRILRETYGFLVPETWQFYYLGRDRVWLIPEQLFEFASAKNFRIELMGLYFAFFDGELLRLSPEASQLVAESATKNVLDISVKDAERVIRGSDLDVETRLDATYVILRCEKGVIGVGKNMKNKVLCQINKNRRVHQL